jgi:hypothetical protein
VKKNVITIFDTKKDCYTYNSKNAENWRKSHFFTNEVKNPSAASAKEVKTEATRLPAS